MIQLGFEWEEAPGAKTLSNPGPGKPASDYTDKPARLTPRQAAFCRNLIRFAEQLMSHTLPITFLTIEGNVKRMDSGCIKIAEHAQFIHPLINSPNGVVETVSLKWSVLPTT
ncbi:hypothetical protein ACQR09_01585 [Bradyrhizobium oligotrophicum]|uniref:hypothetical protein n=1 Tax=Bradyrhizobium oligotrophicum TaxID=44255 RepID=UPI003EB9BBCB